MGDREQHGSARRLRRDLEDAGVDDLLALALAHLGMEVAVVSEFAAGRQVYRQAHGDADAFGIVLGDGPLLDTTICQRMVDGSVPQVVPDTSADPLVRQLPVTGERSIGAYVGVPLRRPDGRLYGSFCALAREPDPDLQPDRSRFLELLGQILVSRLQEREHVRSRRDQVERALLRGEVRTAMQPVVSLVDGRCLGVEALARMPLGPPSEVFAMAHEHGLGVGLEMLAVRRAAEAARWLPVALSRDRTIGVNLSPGVLVAPGVVEELLQALPLSRVLLEVTEDAPVEEYPRLLDALAELRDAGVRLAVDDVGAGYASFRHVLRLHPDVLKVDRSLVHGVAGDRARRAVLSSLVLLGLELGATVVAEGVEEVDDITALTDLGVDAVQGYLLARPSEDPQEWARWASPWRLPSRARHEVTLDLTAAARAC